MVTFMSVMVPAIKKVALTLQGLRAQDREWILAQLTDSEREAIQHELQVLQRVAVTDIVQFSELLDNHPAFRSPEWLFRDYETPVIDAYIEHLPDNTLLLAAHYFEWSNQQQQLVQRRLGNMASINEGDGLTPHAIEALKQVLEQEISNHV